MPRVALLAIVAVFVALAARAAAAPPERVLLADPDPELRHAVESTLAPWQLQVVVEPVGPRDDGAARARAESSGARFVVWRERDQLVVFDRDRAVSERRPARAGAFDPVTAAGAALSVKTMMRLPPLEGGSATVIEAQAPVVPSPREPAGHVELRLAVGAGARVASGTDSGPGGRALLAVMLRPSSARGWRLGLRADLGTATEISRAGFKGTWSDAGVLAAASWTHARGAWELEPWLAGGITRGTLDGTDASTPRTEVATTARFAGGAQGWRRLGLLAVGLGVELALTPGAASYTRTTMGMGAPNVFEAPSFSVVVGLVVAADLGR